MPDAAAPGACHDQVATPEVNISSLPIPPAPPPRLYRRAEGKLLAGVAGGLAEHLRVEPLYVRLGFALLASLGGMGALLYLGCWAVVPQQPGPVAAGSPGGAGAAGTAATTLATGVTTGVPGDPARPAPPGGTTDPDQASASSRDRGQLLALAALAVGAALLLRQAGLGGQDRIVWPALVAGAGVALIWRQADEAQRARWATMSPRFPWMATAAGTSRFAVVLRLISGGLLVVAGGGTFLAGAGELQAARDGLLATVVVVSGLALITGPWWWRMAHDLSAERRERIRSQERAELAAHVHDSVLHTLALIQRHSDSPREVSRLARGQERELRSWLYRPAPGPAVTVAAAIERAAAEVEDTYAVTIEAVVVGDRPVDEAGAALVQATREALVNAARHAGVGDISLYAEVEPAQITVFVRDRGSGFDPAQVPADRHGIAGSIVGRMQRHGGTACLRSAPGSGTEVELTLPLAGRAVGSRPS